MRGREMTNSSPAASPHPGLAVRSQKRAVAVAQMIMDQVSRGGWTPGTKLATEGEMLADLRVSRGTLRESLRFLELNGVVQMKPGPGGGPIVTQPNGRDLASVLGLFLEALGTRYAAIAEVRRALEPPIAALAAERITDTELSLVRKSTKDIEAAIDDVERFLEVNRTFHELVAAASRNPLFSILITSLHHVTDGNLLGVSYPRPQREAVLVAHEAILQGLEAHDPEAAFEAMTKHIIEYQRYLDHRYPDVAENKIRWRDVAP
jgi:GntR family transcriptional repressor for pyruvate dehydrogenase complex